MQSQREEEAADGSLNYDVEANKIRKSDVPSSTLLRPGADPKKGFFFISPQMFPLGRTFFSPTFRTPSERERK